LSAEIPVRCTRLDAGVVYHLLNRGNARVLVFDDAADGPLWYHVCMEPADKQAPVPIAHSLSIATEMRSLAGLSCLVFVPVAITELRDGELRGLFFLVLPTAMLALARWIEHVTPEHAAVLYSDKLEVPRQADKPLVVAWSDVTAIGWPRNAGHTAVRLAVNKNLERPANRVLIDLKDVSPTDRLVLIEYLHRAAGAVEQENWGAFCQRQAVPLAEMQDGRNGAGGEATFATPRWFRSIEKYPFLSGLLSPLLLGPLVVFLLFKVVSRTTYWSLAAIIATSALINIRLVWGRWASSFSEICLGAAAVFFVLGVFAPRGQSSKADPSASLPTLITWWVLALIACPFVANAAVIGWIPRHFGMWTGPAGFVMLFAPAIQMSRTQRHKDNQASLQADAMRRWEVYQTTRSLPSE
jgi:hypothetical protein